MIAALLAAATVTLTIPEPRKLNVERMLDAIAAAEAWKGSGTGVAGEVGPYQMLPSVWMKTKIGKRRPIHSASPAELRAGAKEELLVRIAVLEMNHRTVTPFLAGLSWGAGLTATLEGTASQAKRSYAQRVANLYEDSGAKP